MRQVRLSWHALRGSLWFIPSVMLCVSVVAAATLVRIQSSIDVDLALRWPHLFGAGAQGSRGMLSAIATSMITVAGTVFSITVVALSLAASQYSPRVLRNFMSDRTTQVVLGAFVSIFGYCLVVLRAVRGPDEGGFIPSVAILGGMAMAFAGVFVLIWFVHHVATVIQVSSILDRVTEETTQALGRLFPDELGEGADESSAVRARLDGGRDLGAAATGYLVSIDGDELLERTEARDLIVEVLPRIGEFLIVGLPVLRVHGACDDATAAQLAGCLIVGRQRTIHQDAPFGVQQIVEIAMKALSPGVNDPATAVACIDRLGELLVASARRGLPDPCRGEDRKVQVIAHGPDFASLVALAFDAISEHAADHVEVYERVAKALGQIGQATRDPGRRAALARQLDIVIACADRANLAEHRQRPFHALCANERQRLLAPAPAPAPAR